MESVNVAMLGGPGAAELAGEIAKKGGETDMVQYNHKKGDRSLTLFVPAKYPEKIQGVSYCLQATEHVVLVVDALDRRLGEQIVAIDMTGRTQGFLLLRNYIQPEQVASLLAGTALEHYEVLDTEDPALLRERFLELEPTHREGATRVDVDQHFNVKGVGTVVLGIVGRGSVEKHQELRAYPSTKRCTVRSIQVHDTDLPKADTGARVGLALKGIDSDDLDRGSILAPEGSLRVVTKGEGLNAQVRVPRFYKQGLRSDQVVHLGVGMQFLPARLKIDGGSLEAGAKGLVTMMVANPLVVAPGDQVVLYSLDDPNLRVAGGATVT
ncbi:MAG: hypothetical protein KY455_03325 [Euryarchaeota archaeon]|nr:hypothetical protein [Euryarchaeota archaeon]